MYIYIYIYVYIYIYIYICIYMYMYRYVYASLSLSLSLYIYICISIYLYLSLSLYIHIYIYIYIFIVEPFEAKRICWLLLEVASNAKRSASRNLRAQDLKARSSNPRSSLLPASPQNRNDGDATTATFDGRAPHIAIFMTCVCLCCSCYVLSRLAITNSYQ